MLRLSSTWTEFVHVVVQNAVFRADLWDVLLLGEDLAWLQQGLTRMGLACRVAEAGERAYAASFVVCAPAESAPNDQTLHLLQQAWQATTKVLVVVMDVQGSQATIAARDTWACLCAELGIGPCEWYAPEDFGSALFSCTGWVMVAWRSEAGLSYAAHQEMCTAVPSSVLRTLPARAERVLALQTLVRPHVCVLVPGLRFLSIIWPIMWELLANFRFSVLPVGILTDRGTTHEELVLELQACQADLWWAHYPLCLSDSLVLHAAKYQPVPCIVTMRGACWTGYGAAEAMHTLPYASYIVSLTDAYTQQSRCMFPALCTSRFVTIPNGVDLALLRQRSLFRQKAALPGTAPYVLTSSSIYFAGKMRGAEELAAASDRLHGTLLCTSSQPTPSRQFGPRAWYLGQVGDLFSLFQVVRVFVYHSYQDSQPTALLEALAAGLPCVVVATGGTGVHEMVVDGVTGFVCSDVSSAIVRVNEILANPLLGIEVATHAQQAMRQSWSRTAAGYRVLFDKVLAGGELGLCAGLFDHVP